MYFLLVTDLYAIKKETSTPNVPYNDDHTYTEKDAQYHEESLRSQYIQFVTVSLAVLVVVMCIIYVGTKSIERRGLSTDTTSWTMSWNHWYWKIYIVSLNRLCLFVSHPCVWLWNFHLTICIRTQDSKISLSIITLTLWSYHYNSIFVPMNYKWIYVWLK